MKQILEKNPILFWLGTLHLLVFLLLLAYFPFNETAVLGINSMLKPMKFALSIWIYSWTMALLLAYLDKPQKVKMYSWAAVISMCFEQFAITLQAFRGQLSHFNRTDAFGITLFTLMGIFILTITLWTAYIAYLFIQQKKFEISPSLVLGIRIGMIYFVVFSLFGGYISSLQGHTVGANDGGEGVPFLNWSKFFGDLRVAHFFGIHALQIVPLFALEAERNKLLFRPKNSIWLFSIFYLAFVLFTMVQGLMGFAFW